MPIIIDPQTGTEKVVSQREHDALINSVVDDKRGSLYELQTDRPDAIPLWDVIDGAWTRPLPQGLATSYYLRKVVFKCSACIFTTPYEKLVTAHIRGVMESAGQHKGAEVTSTPPVSGHEPGQQCSGCGTVFSARKGQGRRHLDTVLRMAPEHKGAKELLLKRFALGPPAVPLVVTNGATQEPVVHSGERREGKRRRHRSRSRSKVAT